MSKIKTIVMLNITVFTPTYNRAYILRQLYNSLKTQEYHDFEWLVIDDGSNDSTQQLIESWMAEENSFEIRPMVVSIALLITPLGRLEASCFLLLIVMTGLHRMLY